MPTTVATPTGPCSAVCDPDECEAAGSCEFCGRTACTDHSYDDTRCLEHGPMHEDCHRELCNDRDCWADRL